MTIIRLILLAVLLLGVGVTQPQPLPFPTPGGNAAIPATRFKDGQVLGSIPKGYTITLSKSRGVVFHSLNGDIDAVFLMLGYEVSTKLGKFLQYKNMAGQPKFGEDVILGPLEFVEDLRQVFVRPIHNLRMDSY